LPRDGIGDAGIVDECTGLVGLAALDVDEAVGPANDTGEEREGILEIAIEADDGFQGAGGERWACGDAGGDVDTAGRRGDGDGFGALFRSELEIELVGLFRVQSDAFGESVEAGEGDGDFAFAGEDANEEILAEIVGDGGNFLVGGEAFEGDFGVRPDGLDLIVAEGEDDAREF